MLLSCWQIEILIAPLLVPRVQVRAVLVTHTSPVLVPLDRVLLEQIAWCQIGTTAEPSLWLAVSIISHLKVADVGSQCGDHWMGCVDDERQCCGTVRLPPSLTHLPPSAAHGPSPFLGQRPLDDGNADSPLLDQRPTLQHSCHAVSSVAPPPVIEAEHCSAVKSFKILHNGLLPLQDEIPEFLEGARRCHRRCGSCRDGRWSGSSECAAAWQPDAYTVGCPQKRQKDDQSRA
mmetsp:Transcript_34523/g.85558  ORF Transcript_34523/g.85558 Transcript_34523/m.85558 type:complete len:232 (-) Transcript_34523:125-820(-)